MRTFIGLIVGALMGFLLIFVIQLITHLVFTLPDDLFWADYGQIILYKDSVSGLAVFSIVFGWMVASFCSSITATVLSGDISLFSSAVMAVIFSGVAAYVLYIYSYPSWMWVIGIGGIVSIAIAAGQIANRIEPDQFLRVQLRKR